MGFGRMDHRFFHIVGADVHNVGFRMIEPDNRVIVRHVFLLLSKTSGYAAQTTAV
jgi:hypothetical protein